MASACEALTVAMSLLVNASWQSVCNGHALSKEGGAGADAGPHLLVFAARVVQADRLPAACPDRSSEAATPPGTIPCALICCFAATGRWTRTQCSR